LGGFFPLKKKKKKILKKKTLVGGKNLSKKKVGMGLPPKKNLKKKKKKIGWGGKFWPVIFFSQGKKPLPIWGVKKNGGKKRKKKKIQFSFLGPSKTPAPPKFIYGVGFLTKITVFFGVPGPPFVKEKKKNPPKEKNN